MNYKAYKMKFSHGVHLGNRTLESSEYTFHADTLFSALCHEAKKRGTEVLEQLYSDVKAGDILISDAFPYYQDTLYIPKPVMKVQLEEQGDSKLKKAFKNLSYIPADSLKEYRQGKLNIEEEKNKLGKLGASSSRSMTAVRGKEESLPYRVGVYQFHEGNGLYFVVGYQREENLNLLEELLEQLSYSGIGGKRSAGLGQFILNPCKLPEDMVRRLAESGEQYMSLSVSLPTEDEIEDVLSGAGYLLIKRSGFVASEHYAEEYLRKKDLYVLNAGACVKRRFHGDVYDVSSHGSHPVYRYAKPLLMEVDV